MIWYDLMSSDILPSTCVLCFLFLFSPAREAARDNIVRFIPIMRCLDPEAEEARIGVSRRQNNQIKQLLASYSYSSVVSTYGGWT